MPLSGVFGPQRGGAENAFFRVMRSLRCGSIALRRTGRVLNGRFREQFVQNALVVIDTPSGHSLYGQTDLACVERESSILDLALCSKEPIGSLLQGGEKLF